MEKQWIFRGAAQEKRLEWSKTLGISPLLASVLAERTADIEEAKHFLAGGNEALADPFLLPDMAAAIERIILALERHERIVIFGDYDVDGITSTSVLFQALSSLQASVDYYLPDRLTEGYGLHMNNVDEIAARAELLLTVDCGIRSVAEVERAKALGLDVIVTDHHLPGAALPPALAVIDPKRPENRFPDGEIAGVGIAFEICRALWQKLGHLPFTMGLDLVALGTVADVVPLRRENRKFVQLGLQKIENIGLKALLQVSGLADKEITAGHIGFMLGPRLNAAGRIGDANEGVQLLLTQDEQKAALLAQHLDEQNKQRQAMVEAIFQEALQRLTGAEKPHYAIVIAGENWHPGIIGIVASRLVEHFYLPTIVLSSTGALAKGSCRSIPGFDIYQALEANRSYLKAFGGHKQAAGLSLSMSELAEFRAGMERYAAAQLTAEDFVPKLKISGILKPEQIDSALIEELKCLEPYGMGNPAPLFLCGNSLVQQARAFGRDNAHLRLSLQVKEYSFNGIGWQKGALLDEVSNKTLDFVFSPEINVWQNREYLQLIINDFQVSNDTASYPTRAYLRFFYLAMRKAVQQGGDLQEKVRQLLQAQGYLLDDALFARCIKIFAEIDILAYADGQITFLPQGNGKKDLYDSPTFRERYFRRKINLDESS